MKNKFSLNTRIDELLKKKLSICECNPCTCSEKTKEQYFQELKDVLKRFNMEKLAAFSFKSIIDK